MIKRIFFDNIYKRLLMNRRNSILLPSLLFSATLFAQTYPTFTHADTLRGMLSQYRSCYWVTFYDLHLRINIEKHTVSGYNTIVFKNTTDFTRMQVDLFSNMTIDSIMHGKTKLTYKRDTNAVFVDFPTKEQSGQKDSIKFYYHGVPREAVRAPWDGGFVWGKDSLGRPWVDVACEGTGASLWWPCKDHLSNKPDSMHMSFEVPDGLTCVANGRLRSVKKLNDGYTRFNWAVTKPIINYDVTLNIANYAHIHDYYLNGKDTLTLDYYVLDYNKDRATNHFKQVKPMIGCYERYFGKYPFYADGYKLVETNYWGMEHQSCVAYGNEYKNNKFGFDFIIIHESGHEWWGNNISCSDEADMWIHESFTTYAEALYLECAKGYKTSVDYLVYQRSKIVNKYPIVGPYNVNFQGTSDDNDMYYKGTWMLQTFRHVLNNDTVFFGMLKGLQKHFNYQSTCTDSIVAYINKYTGKDYTSFFTEYLKYASPPEFVYELKETKKGLQVDYKMVTGMSSFTMPVKITSKVKDSVKTYITVNPTPFWQTIDLPGLKADDFSVDTDEFYVIPVKAAVWEPEK